MEVGSSVLNRAEELVQKNVSIKMLDAIYVASLMSFQTASRTGIPLITGDGRQREAATHLGLDNHLGGLDAGERYFPVLPLSFGTQISQNISR